MKLGIKVASNKEDINRLQRTKAKHCEVRFILEEKEKYKEVLNYCREKGIEANFHHWASFDGILANPAAPGKLGKWTVASIKKTIKIAAENKAGYVVFHPGQTKKNKINHEQKCIRPLETIAKLKEAEELLFERLKKLNSYAERHGVLLIVESIPKYDPEYWLSAEGRKSTIDIGSLPLSTIEKIVWAGFVVANDFEHTSTHSYSKKREDIFKFLYRKTNQLIPQTKLLHLGYTIPPYNGTDYHGNLSNPEFNSKQALPNKKETLKLLQLFKNHKDVWIIPEPQSDHVGSYQLAQSLLAKP